MRLNNMKEVKGFKAAIDSCKDNVWMMEGKDTFYNLKSELTQFVVLAKLLEDNDLELYTSSKEDEYRMLAFLQGQSKRAGHGIA